MINLCLQQMTGKHKLILVTTCDSLPMVHVHGFVVGGFLK